jgi:hypothetical protein
MSALKNLTEKLLLIATNEWKGMLQSGFSTLRTRRKKRNALPSCSPPFSVTSVIQDSIASNPYEILSIREPL